MNLFKIKIPVSVTHSTEQITGVVIRDTKIRANREVFYQDETDEGLGPKYFLCDIMCRAYESVEAFSGGKQSITVVDLPLVFNDVPMLLSTYENGGSPDAIVGGLILPYLQQKYGAENMEIVTV